MTFLELQIDRASRIIWYCLSMVIRPFVKVRKNRAFFWAYDFDKYACNPKALTEYIIENHPDDFEIYWAFDRSFDTSVLDKRIKVVRIHTIAYAIALYSSRFVINNRRTIKFGDFFIKKSQQLYLMLWHGSFPLKKIEKDVEEELGYKYVNRAKLDSKMCDLMITDSIYYENIVKSSFWYDGTILRCGTPRNDILCNIKKINHVRSQIRARYNISDNERIVLYAPTFRKDRNLKYYKLNWPRVIESISIMYNSPIRVFIRLHPLLSKVEDIKSIINDERIINVTSDPDITEYLLSADVMISDYTSAMFDFCLLNRPCFIYAVDSETYNRGFYINIDELPFPIAKNEEELIRNFRSFNNELYKSNLLSFINEKWRLFEAGHACHKLYSWMLQNA